MEQKRLANFVGQDKIRESLAVLLMTAKKRGEALDHILFGGPFGYGKATLAQILADELGVNMKAAMGSGIVRPGDAAAILTNLRAGDVLFIDEIHRLGRAVEEMLIDAMENFGLDIVIGKGASVRSIRLKLPHFTVVGATTRLGQVDERLARLMLVYDFAPYTVDELEEIILSLAKEQGIKVEAEAAKVIAQATGGNPSRAATLLQKVSKIATTHSEGSITPEIAKASLSVFGSIEPVPERERQLIPDDVKIFVWQRDKGRCVVCGSQENLEFDHIIPVSKGGSNTARNIQLLCEKHNRSKGGNIV